MFKCFNFKNYELIKNNKYYQPTVGPIVGEATTDCLRIFVRGKKSDNIQYAIIQIAPKFFNWKNKLCITQKIKLNSYFDYSGVFIFTNLGMSEYKYRVICIENNINNINFPNNTKEYNVKLQSCNIDEKCSFILGSCRYTNEFHGLYQGDLRSDKIFKEIYKNCSIDNVNTLNIDLQIFCGDQIYADDMNKYSEDSNLITFFEKYRHQFSTANFAKCLANIPTYMVIDDHEIEDNWPSNKSVTDHHKFTNAMTAYQIYQASHSPLFSVNNNKIIDLPDKWWYKTSCGCCDFFFMDTRTERNLKHNSKIISSEQMNALKKFLTETMDNKVKCIVAGVLLFPNYLDGEDGFGDKLFVKQRNEIISYIFDNKINKVVFLGGDIHISMTSVLKNSDNNCKIIQVVSSPLYWPFSFGNGYPEDYSLNCILPDSENMKSVWTVKTKSKFIRDNNFSRIDVTNKNITVSVIGRKGSLLDKNTYTF